MTTTISTQPAPYRLSWVKHTNSRRAQWNHKNVAETLARHGFTVNIHPTATMIAYVYIQDVEERKKVDAALRSIHPKLGARLDKYNPASGEYDL